MRSNVRYGARCCRLLLASAVSLPILSAAPSAFAQRQTDRRFQPVRVIPVQPAIKDVPVIEADRVRGQVADSELVLGVVIKGKARAYPINMLTGPSREIINDTLGGQPIAATW